MKLPRVRFMVRRMMLILALAAVALAAWRHADRRWWAPYRERLEAELAWCRSTAGGFFSRPPGSPPTRGPAVLLKVSALEGPDPEGRHYENRWAVAQDGQLSCQLSHPRGRREWNRRLPSGSLALVRAALATLPPPDRVSSSDRLILLSYLDKGEWSTARYRRESPPVQLQELLTAVGISLP